MAQVIIGRREGGFLQTNHKSSEKFVCQAVKDRQAKIEKQYKALTEEIERRNLVNYNLY